MNKNFLLALAIRVIFTVYGLYHDRESQRVNNDQSSAAANIPKYTDVDYQVFTDAAHYVYQGESPYLRDTYRYTPILAYILQPNIFLTESFGKFIFILFDLLCGYLIIKINELNKASAQESNVSASFWFYNVTTITISSRGNAESLMAFLVLAFVYQLRQQNYILAGLLFGVSIHFKIYPVTYCLAIAFHIANFRTMFAQKSIFQLLKSILTDVKLYKFFLSFAGVLVFLTAFFYYKYGYIFLYETYLYHLTRQDIRHNFSPYFYMLYLTDLTWSGSLLLRLFNFLPQVTLILTFSYYLHQQLELCLFLITFTFVTFNKVCTSQYFVWYLSLIPLLIPRLRISILKGGLYFLLWIVGQLIWLYFAYELEFLGKNTFIPLWISSLLFAAINCWIVKFVFLDCYEFQIEPTKTKIN